MSGISGRAEGGSAREAVLRHPRFERAAEQLEAVPARPSFDLDGQDGAPTPMTEFEVVRWARVGALDPDAVCSLRAHGVLPAEAERTMVIESGDTISLLRAVEFGRLDAEDVALAAATWPGRGWTYEPAGCRWSIALAPEVLATLARRLDRRTRSLRADDRVLGAQMALELRQRSAAYGGVDLVVRCAGPDTTTPWGWRDAIDEDLLAASARAAAERVEFADPAGRRARAAWLDAGEMGSVAV